jgi:hypothetical protein
LRNVLIISFIFNQMESIGSVRVRGLVKYLPEFGWNPIILTVKTSSAISEKQKNIFETPYNDSVEAWKRFLHLPLNKSLPDVLNISQQKQKKTPLDKIIGLWYEIFIFPDQTINWSVSAVKKGEEILSDFPIDAIISSIHPLTPHIIAHELLKKKKIPWIADFRDLWSQNYFCHYSRVREFFDQRLELRTVSPASALTTVSYPLSEKLQELHKNKKVYTITNGYDPDQLNPGIPLSKKLSITYTGRLYRGNQDPEPLFRTLKVLIDEKVIDPSLIEIHFFGEVESWLISDIKKYDLENIIQLHGQILRKESIHKQRESQVLLLLSWNDPEQKGVYTGKVFDYLAARRPILSIGLKGSVVNDLLDQTRAGLNASTDEEIKECIMHLYREYLEIGSVRYSGISTEIEKYSHREMAKKFAKVLDEISKPGENTQVVIEPHVSRQDEI